jgi:hypothetical protein
MRFLAGLPAVVRFFFWLLIVIVVIVVVAWLIDKLGGFNLPLHIGKFHFDIGVT